MEKPQPLTGAEVFGDRKSNKSSARSLNPSLFGMGPQPTFIGENTVSSQLPHLMQTEQKILETKEQIGALAEQLGKWTENYSEFNRGCQIKFERIYQALQKLENNDQLFANEISSKFNRINDRLSERKNVDAKLQEMMDRHNSVIKSCELRISQMQKLLSEKEAVLVAAQAALNEAKMEIVRLKRL